jgi:hypothetical protein
MSRPAASLDEAELLALFAALTPNQRASFFLLPRGCIRRLSATKGDR